MLSIFRINACHRSEKLSAHLHMAPGACHIRRWVHYLQVEHPLIRPRVLTSHEARVLYSKGNLELVVASLTPVLLGAALSARRGWSC